MAVFCLLVGLGPSARAQLARQPAPLPEVLILNSYAVGYEWSDDELSGLLDVLKKDFPSIEPMIQYMDYRRFPDLAKREAWLLPDIIHKVGLRPPKLIITLDNAAFDFALRHRSQLGAGTPIVFGGLNRFTPDMLAGQSRITGVSEESDRRGSFELIRRLRPGTRKILLISTRTPSGLETTKSFDSVIHTYSDRYDFELYDTWTNEQLFQRIASLPNDTTGLIIEATRDIEGKNNYNDPDFSRTLSTRARQPLFIISHPPGKNDWSVLPWEGVGGGLVVAELHGRKVGELASRILKGEDAGAIPVVRFTPELLAVDYRQINRFGLDMSLLPEGTVVYNLPSSFYQVHKIQIILALVVIVILSAAVLLLSINIVRRKRAEGALRKVEEQLRSSQKMEAIGLLAGGIAHDFNNMLQVIRGHASLLLYSTSYTVEQRGDLEAIQDAAVRASQLTRQLLLFSRKQDMIREPIDPNALVSEMLKMLQRLIGEHIEVIFTPLASACRIFADKGQLEQVLLNLCVNARDAMPGGGRILIALETMHLTKKDCSPFPGLEPGSFVQIMVQDTGCGMSKEVMARIFEPFFTTKQAGQGTGLGLSVVYGIVHQHKGHIRVYSEPGSGSVFKVLLPVAEHAASLAVESDKSEVPRGSGLILLAEDDAQVRELGRRILMGNGFEVITAADGVEAEQLFDENVSRLRLVILDVMMPKRSGRKVFDHIREISRDFPVLFCSGYSYEMLSPEVAPRSESAILAKPYLARDLLLAVHRLLKTKAPST